ncbi:uncharacterized protein SAPINGB_P005717 [Magnusiomyces paraingens]|uniref:Histidinol-phosphatase n=1 Tax=Magnusiomyces paraingens TaxID=2606893 RepID=A0A5E8C675_9ASCO|nr:uncharacterized protein SAPINGB_P005717 [Saprochaete ingens]VVT57481.1 unnamed protein product [Saprochaete ingens]
MHTHHSHSGQYVQHAKDTLEEVVAAAEARHFDVFCLTEHMPRYDPSALYPEELESKTTPADLVLTFEQYYIHAKAIQEKTNKRRQEQIEKGQNKGEQRIPQILVGFECEALSDAYLEHVSNLRATHQFDLFVGSVHHVHGVPIDFDEPLWLKAAKISSPEGSLEDSARALFNDYFDLQYKLFIATTPPVIGHFDLIRLFCPVKQASPETLQTSWPDVWGKIVRNVKYAAAYGALFELNSAAVRKGWPTPYPGPDIGKLILENKGKFCLSDDSHGIAQVGLNYHKSLEYLQDLGAENLHYLALDDSDLSKPASVHSIPVSSLPNDIFFKSL